MSGGFKLRWVWVTILFALNATRNTSGIVDAWTSVVSSLSKCQGKHLNVAQRSVTCSGSRMSNRIIFAGSRRPNSGDCGALTRDSRPRPLVVAWREAETVVGLDHNHSDSHNAIFSLLIYQEPHCILYFCLLRTTLTPSYCLSLRHHVQEQLRQRFCHLVRVLP